MALEAKFSSHHSIELTPADLNGLQNITTEIPLNISNAIGFWGKSVDTFTRAGFEVFAAETNRLQRSIISEFNLSPVVEVTSEDTESVVEIEYNELMSKGLEFNLMYDDLIADMNNSWQDHERRRESKIQNKKRSLQSSSRRIK